MQIEERHIAPLARGCALLGAGGGGDTRGGEMLALEALRRYGPVQLVTVGDMTGEDDLVLPCGMIGAPTVSSEKLSTGKEGRALVDTAEALFGSSVGYLMDTEIGGMNGLLPIAWAAQTGLPLLDADGMGRCFPEIPQLTMELAGVSASPMVMVDERDQSVVLRTVDGHWAERIARTVADAMGGSAMATEYIMTVRQARTAVVAGSVSLALRMGETVLAAADPVESLVEQLGGRLLLHGKLVDVDRRTSRGFVRGSVVLEGLDDHAGRLARVEIQNENLVVLEDGAVLASVPDIITVVDDQTGAAVGTESLRYGQRVCVMAFPCAPIWRTPAGLALAGPRAFGYEFDYEPVEVARVDAR